MLPSTVPLESMREIVRSTGLPVVSTKARLERHSAGGLEAVLVEADDVGGIPEADGEVGRDAGEELAGGSLALAHDGDVGVVAAPGDHDRDVGDDAQAAVGVVETEGVERRCRAGSGSRRG